MQNLAASCRHTMKEANSSHARLPGFQTECAFLTDPILPAKAKIVDGRPFTEAKSR
jgi:hypothetical protein